MNITRTENNSNLPSNIPKIIIHLLASGKVEKLTAGPKIGFKAGPTLPIDVAAQERLLKKSNPKAASKTAIIK